MNIPEIKTTTFPIDIKENAAIDSKDLRSFFNAAARDINTISSLLNNTLIEMLKKMPKEFDPKENSLDGTSLYLNNNAKGSDNDIFYMNNAVDPDKSRPLTIYESMLLFLQVLANIDNGLKEGISIGNMYNPISIEANESKEYAWSYTDGVFKPLLFIIENNSITAAEDNIKITLSVSSQRISIKNNSTSKILIFGHIWHPVLSFGQ